MLLVDIRRTALFPLRRATHPSFGRRRAGRIFSVDAEGRDKQGLVTGCQLPDGIAVDPEGRSVAELAAWENEMMSGLPKLRGVSSSAVSPR